MHTTEIHAAIREDRKHLMSIKDLAEKYGLGKSTIYYIVRDMPENAEANRRSRSLKASQQLRKHMSTETKQKIARRVRDYWSSNRRRVSPSMAANVRNAVKIAGVTYRLDELPIKTALERMFNTQFTKEAIGSRYVDFANNELIIEVTSDASKGVQDLTRRLVEVRALDSRKLIAFIPDKGVGPLRKERLTKLGIEIRYVSEIS